MSKANPRKAMAALLPLTVRAEDGGFEYEVKPMTLGMWAALERINSPLVTGIEPRDTMELLPSLYLLTHDPREVFRGNLLELAFEWASRQSVGAVAAIRAACERQISAVTDVLPESDIKKKNPTDGSPRSSIGRPQPTTGTLKTSSGKPRSRPSRCSAGKNGSRTTRSSL